MSSDAWVAIIASLGAILGAAAAIYSVLKTTHQAEGASERDDANADERNTIESLKALADQGRQDRAEMRAEREVLWARMDSLEAEVRGLRDIVAALERERTESRTRIAGLLAYIRRLLRFIEELGHAAPKPDDHGLNLAE